MLQWQFAGADARRQQTLQHIPHHDHAGAGHLLSGDGDFQLRQGAYRVALGGQAGVLDDCHRRVGMQAVQQLVLYGGRATDTHVDDQRQARPMGRGRECAPVGAGRPGLGVAGDKHHAMRVLAVGQWHTQRRHGRHAGGDAVDDAHTHACGLQGFHLFTTTTKDEGVATFEAHHGFAFQRGRDHQLLDKGLRSRFATAAFANINDAGGGGCESNDGLVHQIIDQHHGGLLDGLQGLEGQQFRVTWAGTHQGDMATCAGVRKIVFHSESTRCKMWATCWAIGVGTGCAPSSTLRM